MKIGQETIERILEAAGKGLPNVAIAAETGVCRDSVKRIRDRYGPARENKEPGKKLPDELVAEWSEVTRRIREAKTVPLAYCIRTGSGIVFVTDIHVGDKRRTSHERKV